MSDEINITGSGPQNAPRGNTGGRPSFSLSSDLQRQAAAAARSITAEQKAAIAAFKEMYREASTENKGYNTKLRAALTQQKNEHRATLSDAWDENRSFDKRRQAAYRTSSAYYATKEIGNLGYQGTKAINNGSLKELIMIDRHLAKMDRNLEKYVKTNGLSSQEQDARRKTARSALSSSYSQLSAAAEGAPGFKGWASRAIMAHRAGGGGGMGGGGRGFGGRIGGAMLGAAGMGLEGLEMAAGPVGAILATAGAVYKAPAAVADAYNKNYLASKPYYDIENFAGKWGLTTSAGTNMPGYGTASYNELVNPSANAPWMRQLGVSKSDYMGIMNAYGIAPNFLSSFKDEVSEPGGSTANAEGIGDIVHYISTLKYNPAFASLSDNDRVNFARTQSLTGDTSGATLDKISAALNKAVSDGADKSAVLKSIEVATMQSAANGGQGGMSGILNLNNRLLDSGANGSKTGALQATVSSAVENMYDSLGTNPLTSIPFMSYINSHGGVQAGAKALPPEVYARLSKSGNYNDQRLLKDLNSNVSPLVYAQLYGTALKGDDDQGMQILDSWNAQQGLSSGNSDYLAAKQLNVPLGASVAYHSNSGNGNTTAITGSTYASQQKAMSYFTGQGWSPEQAAGIVGNIQGEDSTWNTGAVNPKSGAYGLFQWLGARKQALFAEYGPNPTFDQQLAFAQQELSSSESATGSTLKKQKSAYDAGVVFNNGFERNNLDATGQMNRGNNASSVLGTYSDTIANANLAQAGNGPKTDASDSATKAAQQASNGGAVMDSVYGSVSKITAAAVDVTSMVVHTITFTGGSSSSSTAGVSNTAYRPKQL